jgi:hypothetical protein
LKKFFVICEARKWKDYADIHSPAVPLAQFHRKDEILSFHEKLLKSQEISHKTEPLNLTRTKSYVGYFNFDLQALYNIIKKKSMSIFFFKLSKKNS